MTKWDKILIVVIIIISLGAIGGITYYKSQIDVLYGIIEVDGKEQERINLSDISKPYEIRIEDDNHYNIIRIEEGRMAFIEATCPDQDCIHIGWIDAPGETSICLPNRVMIRVISSNGEKGDIDSTTY